MSSSKRKKRVRAVLGVLLVLLVGAPIILIVCINWRLDARLDAIRKAGDPVTPAELDEYYPDPPQGKNAATFFNAAFELIEDAFDDPHAEPLPIVGVGELPELGEPLPPDVLKAIRAYLADNAEAIRLLRQATALDDSKFQLDFSHGVGTDAPHLGRVRQAARLFALEAIERIESGRHAEAAESLRASLRCGFVVYSVGEDARDDGGQTEWDVKRYPDLGFRVRLRRQPAPQ